MNTVFIREAPLFPKKIIALAAFILVEIMMFAGLLTSFIILKVNQFQWPPVFQPKFPLMVTGINSIILLLAGVTIHFAFSACKNDCNYKLAFQKVFCSCFFLFVFLVVQGVEWYQLMLDGLHVRGIYGGLFVLIIGAHGLHVLLGLVVNIWLANKIRTRQLVASQLQNIDGHLSLCCIYTWFVVGLWPCIYFIVYF